MKFHFNTFGGGEEPATTDRGAKRHFTETNESTVTQKLIRVQFQCAKCKSSGDLSIFLTTVDTQHGNELSK